MSTRNNATLLLLGVNHTTAPLEVRERLAISSSRLADATRTLAHQPGIREALILSTCNRVEFLVHHEEASIDTTLSGFLHDYFAVAPASLAPHLYHFRER